jgi:hypothetical protein
MNSQLYQGDNVGELLEAGATIEDLIADGWLDDDLDVRRRERLERIASTKAAFAATFSALPAESFDDDDICEF